MFSRLSWPATLAALTALLTLIVTGGNLSGPNSLILFGMMVTLLALRVTSLRLPPAAWAHWAVRIPLYALVLFFNWYRLNDPNSWLVDTSAVPAFGMFAAAELVVQSLRTLPPGENNGAAIFLLSGFVFMTACNTDQILTIRIASPVYFACAVLSLPRFAAHLPRREEMRSISRRGLAVLAALALGAGIYFLFWTFRTQLMQIGAGAIHEHQSPDATGLSQQPTLGPTFGQPGSFQRILRLTGDAGGHNYLRGLVYDSYNLGQWNRIDPSQRPHFWNRDGHRRFGMQPVPRGALHPEAAGATMTVTTLAGVLGIVFVPLETTGIRLREEDDSQIQRDPQRGVYHVNSSLPGPYSLVFGSHVLTTLSGTMPTPRVLTADLRVPREVSPRVFALARQITQGRKSPAERAAAVQQYLFTHNKYSLTTDPGAGDPVSNFILGHKAAHCEFFASAAVILMRCAGVPARYVTGYYAHESTEPGMTVVRQQDAHAWAEAWIPGTGWTTVDATPADGRPSRTAETIPPLQRALEWFQDKVAALRAWLGHFTAGQILGMLAGLTVLYFGLRWLWRYFFRRNDAESEFSYSSTRNMEAFARRFEQWLRRSGAPCPPETPWEEHIRLEGLDSARPFVESYNAARFGPGDAERTLAQLDAELRRLETRAVKVDAA